MSARIRKGDVVEIISGSRKGHRGKVLQMFPREDACIVEKGFIVKKHQKAKSQGTLSGIVEKNMKIRLCKVMAIEAQVRK